MPGRKPEPAGRWPVGMAGLVGRMAVGRVAAEVGRSVDRAADSQAVAGLGTPTVAEVVAGTSAQATTPQEAEPGVRHTIAGAVGSAGMVGERAFHAACPHCQAAMRPIVAEVETGYPHMLLSPAARIPVVDQSVE